ncbi:MAG: hypothetical protein R2800_05235 [Flavipsychrobacter sp.]
MKRYLPILLLATVLLHACTKKEEPQVQTVPHHTYLGGWHYLEGWIEYYEYDNPLVFKKKEWVALDSVFINKINADSIQIDFTGYYKDNLPLTRATNNDSTITNSIYYNYTNSSVKEYYCRLYLDTTTHKIKYKHSFYISSKYTKTTVRLYNLWEK